LGPKSEEILPWEQKKNAMTQTSYMGLLQIDCSVRRFKPFKSMDFKKYPMITKAAFI